MKYVLPGANPGLLKKGTIDIDARLKVHVPVGNGFFASVRSVSFHIDPGQCLHFGLRLAPPARSPVQRRPSRTAAVGAEILVPTVIPRGGRMAVVSFGAAADHAWNTGQHLGIFDTPAHATSYANRLHLEQARGFKLGK